jgi:dATP pyrophosphohydrolase
MAEIPIRCFAVSVVLLRKAPSGCEVLLLRRNHTLIGEWCQIAGGIEDGEKAWEAALREVREETGLVCDLLYSADICEQFYEADRDAISMLPVFVGFMDTRAAVVINEEHSEFRWVSFEAAERMVPFAGQHHVLKHVEAEFVRREPVHHLLIHESATAAHDPSLTIEGYDLLLAESADDQSAYHRIRRTVLFEARGQFDYVADESEEIKEENLSLLFKHNLEPIGTVRLDQKSDRRAIVRLVAIASHLQRQGHGAALIRHVERLARSLGINELLVHSAPDAVGFYQKLGFSLYQFAEGNFRSVQLRKLV